MNNILQAGMHPDADRLSTFVEGAASAHEREAMLAHLAECPDCRSVVFLMQAKEEKAAAPGEAARGWKRGWLLPGGLAGAALACALAAVVYVRTHHPAGQIAMNNSQVQTPITPRTQVPATMEAERAPLRGEPGERERARPKSANAGTGKRSGASVELARTIAATPAAQENTAGTAIAALKAAHEPPAAAPPVSAPQLTPDVAETQQSQIESRNAATTANLAVKKSLPSLQIEHDHGPDDGMSQVSGLVTDQTGAAVGGATVALSDQAGKTRQTTSNGDGSFNLVGVPPGKYELKVMARGFQAYRQLMELKPRDMAKLDTKLTVGSESQTVTVAAAALAVQTDSNVISSLNSEQISKVPTENRNFAALAELPAQVSLPELPSHKPAAMTAFLGGRVVSLDSAGTLFASHDGGRKWKRVKPRWAANVAHIESSNSDASKTKGRAVNAPDIFQLTTVDGAVWVSKDGTHWHAR